MLPVPSQESHVFVCLEYQFDLFLQFFYCISENSSVSVIISVFHIIPTYWSYFRLSHFIKVLLKFYVISYFVDKPVTQHSETYSKVYMYAGIIGK